MVHHSCYLNISFEADRLLFFLGPGPSAARAELRCVAGFGCTRSATAQFAQG